MHAYDYRDYADIFSSKLENVCLKTRKASIVYEYEDEDGCLVKINETVPVKMEVCPSCGGFGKYVNPNIDRNGLTQEDFDDDPDFRENYFDGLYDITCTQCKGEKLIPTIDVNNINGALKEKVEKYLDFIRQQEEDEYYYRRECEAERRYCGGW
jgi:hypothetical protein